MSFHPGLFIAPALVFFLVSIIVLFFLSFILPALPSAAIEDHAVTLLKSFALTKGNRFALTLVLLFGSFIPFWGIPAVIEIWLISSAIAGIEDPFKAMFAMAEMQSSFSMQVIFPIISAFFSMFGLAVGVSLLSASYRRLRDNVQLEDETPTA